MTAENLRYPEVSRLASRRGTVPHHLSHSACVASSPDKDSAKRDIVMMSTSDPERVPRAADGVVADVSIDNGR
jgi:hypothetical protein